MRNSHVLILSRTRCAAVYLLAFTAVPGLWCVLEARALRSRQSTHASVVRQVEQMSADAARIRSLQHEPRLVAERERPNDQLVAQIESAMAAAAITPQRWIGHDPLPAVRVPQSPYRRLTVGLTFEEITLRQLVQFAHELTENDPTLSIPELRLSTPPHQTPDTWNVTMSLSYLIYAPWQAQPKPS